MYEEVEGTDGQQSRAYQVPHEESDAGGEGGANDRW